MLTVNTLLVLVFTSSVFSSALEDNYNSKILASESYKYNHPPSFEPYDIPDSNVFQVRKSRNSDSIVDSWSVRSNAEAEKVRSDDRSQVNGANKKVKRRKLVRSQNPLNESNGAVNQALPNLNEKKDSVTIQPESTSPSPKTIVPKTFTKRPAQFNPVTKRTWENSHRPVVKILEETNHVFSHNGNFHYRYVE